MNTFKWRFFWGLGVATFGFWLLTKTVKAETQIIYEPPDFVNRNQDPDRLGSGGSPRPDCASLGLPTDSCDIEPLPIIPISDRGYIGLTTENTPTFWIYIPSDMSQLAQIAIFELLDEDLERVIPQMQVDLSETPGIVAISPPPDTVLVPGETYIWHFQIPITDSSLDPVLRGEILRVNIPETIRSEDSPLERAASFAENGIWFDALAELVDVQDTYPDVLADFLQQNGMNAATQSQFPTSK